VTLTGAAATDFGLDSSDGGASTGALITISNGIAFAGAGPVVRICS
jgi:hypothetical protein